MNRMIIVTLLLLIFNSCAENKNITTSGNSIQFGTESTLDIVTWNIQYFPKNNFTVDYLAELIDSMNVDIIAMQEIWGDGASNSFDNLKNQLDGWNGYRKSSGLAYLYKIEIVINDIYEINNLNEIIRTPYLLSINWNGQDIYIINNHFKAFGGAENEAERKIASEKIENYIKEYLEDLNVIVLGDLNDELNDEESINVFQNFIIDSTNYKFVDMDIAYGSSDNFSWPGWHQNTYNSAHFDHILITNELFDEFKNEGSSVQTIRIEEYFDNGWSEYENYISDHRPVGLRLKFSQ
ncbi:MAG: endonuclease/exonuclease/phosphatase family protein [Candidatus Marinimicrobia bacterium]|nr:endonuclease/exonuclease/phosphatase family protein [Candidatus Neomarinimicrobiota bacterium]